jgi:stage V sporulation protein AC
MDKSKAKYKEIVSQSSPHSHIIKDCFNAFWVGGLICVLGEFITNIFLRYEYSLDIARTWSSIILIFIGVILTGLGIYDKIGKFAGAGTVIPITGFANAIAAPALEFKKEGYILGLGAKIFLIAGPVIIYGCLASVIVGFFYYLSLC